MGATITVEQDLRTNEQRWELLQTKAREHRAVQAFALFRENGIEPILIKGVAAARFYPQSKTRFSIDIDLAVSAIDFPRAQALATSAAADRLAIDLHRELRHLDTVDWQNLFENSHLLDLDKGKIRVLRPEDHLRVLCVHWLTDGGSNKEKLWDIYHIVANRPADFDWGRFLNVVPPRRRRWLVCAIGLAHKFLGLDLHGTPIHAEARELPHWLVQTVEREWAAEVKTWPLEASLHDRKLLATQVKKRLRPNPIWATIQMEGSFDARTRVFYQLGSVLKRIVPSLRRIKEAVRLRTA
ncbi:MAG: nucleotidyltransferase family protein [Pyrinomonadaceae bacterium]